MNQPIKYAVGTDVSKDKLDVCFFEVDADQSQRVKGRRQFSNTPGGHKDLDNWCRKHRHLNLPIHVLMEATGVYHEQLALFLQRKQYVVSVVLPTKAKRYMQSIGLKTKNDKIDAIGLGRMCAEQRHKPWQPMAAYFYKLRQLTRYHQRLQMTKTSFGNLLHSVEHSAFASKDVIKYPQKMLDEIQKQLKKVELHIHDHIGSDAEVAKKVENIGKIKGVGLLTIATVIAETNGFALFNNIGQLIKYAGYDVVEDQSGIRKGKTKISKKGNSHIRRILYMPAIGAVTCNQKPFVNLFNRVFQRTGIKMKGYVAVQKKLLVYIYTLWKKNEAFDQNYSQLKQDTSVNEESNVLFPLSSNGGHKLNSVVQKEVVPQQGGTTQDGHRCNESPNVLFPLVQT